MKILRINIKSGGLLFEIVPEAKRKLGRRRLVAKVMLGEFPSLCEPLGPNIKLIFTPGLMVGSFITDCDWISVTGKSSLACGIKEANTGLTTCLCMVWLNPHALIVEGKPYVDGRWRCLYIDGKRFQSKGWVYNRIRQYPKMDSYQKTYSNQCCF